MTLGTWSWLPPEAPAPRQRALSFQPLSSHSPDLSAAPQTQRSSQGAASSSPPPCSPRAFAPRPSAPPGSAQARRLTRTPAAAGSSAGPGARRPGLHARPPQALGLRARRRRWTRSVRPPRRGCTGWPRLPHWLRARAGRGGGGPGIWVAGSGASREAPGRPAAGRRPRAARGGRAEASLGARRGRRLSMPSPQPGARGRGRDRPWRPERGRGRGGPVGSRRADPREARGPGHLSACPAESPAMRGKVCFSLAPQRIVQKAKFALAQLRPLRPHRVIPAILARTSHLPSCAWGPALRGARVAPAFSDTWTVGSSSPRASSLIRCN